MLSSWSAQNKMLLYVQNCPSPYLCVPLKPRGGASRIVHEVFVYFWTDSFALNRQKGISQLQWLCDTRGNNSFALKRCQGLMPGEVRQHLPIYLEEMRKWNGEAEEALSNSITARSNVQVYGQSQSKITFFRNLCWTPLAWLQDTMKLNG